MVRNFLPQVTQLRPEWYSGHFWSLAVEEHFYLLFPAFLLLVRRNRLAILALTVACLELWRLLVYAHPALQGGMVALDFRTDLAIGFILIGCVFAVAVSHPHLRQYAERWLQPWVALTLAACTFTSLSLHHSRLNHALLVPLYPLLILSTVLHPTSLLGRLLSLAPLRYLGRISFSLYLWQQLFLFPYTAPPPGTLRSHTLLCWLAAFACALTSYYLIERPFIRLGHDRTPTPT